MHQLLELISTSLASLFSKVQTMKRPLTPETLGCVSIWMSSNNVKEHFSLACLFHVWPEEVIVRLDYSQMTTRLRIPL